MRFLFFFLSFLIIPRPFAFSQVDTTLLFDNHGAFGPLDIRLSKGPGHGYYLEENKTYSFRRGNEGPTNHYLNMTAWDSSPYEEGHLRERDDSSDLFVMNYRLLTPQGYQPDLQGGYPLVVVLHGFLERGNCAGSNCYHADRQWSPNTNDPPAPTAADEMLLNNDYNLVHAGSDFLEAHDINGTKLPDDPDLPSRAYPGFVIFPQNLNGWDPSSCQDVIRLIRLMAKRFNIDKDRIYINGISHGGHGAYEVLKRAPWLFAAAVLFSAAGDASLVSQKLTDRISGIPLWIFQGALDRNPARQKTENYIQAFRRAGTNVRYTLYPQLGHGTWNKALDEPDFFSWLLAQRRNDIHVNGGAASICETSGEGLKLTLPRGFKKYEWEYNGTIVLDDTLHAFIAEHPGIYRGRFVEHGPSSEENGSKWSAPLNVTASAPPVPDIEQRGTVLLRDLNEGDTAYLSTPADFAFYHWYKDGKPIGSLGDTLRSVSIDPTMGDGSYSLRVSGYDGCQSPLSESKNVVFSDRAPVELSAPFNLEAEVISPSEISLKWSDTSALATRFEIWREGPDGPADSSLWVMPVLAEPNTSAFVDRNLKPGTTYHYKIRAVTQSLRSDYFPASGEVAASTPPDGEPPSAPRNLSASQAGVKAIRLSWTPSVDNSLIQEYIIYYSDFSVRTNSSDTTVLLKDLQLNADYSFVVKAADPTGNLSAESNVAQANTFMSGLYYEHSTGDWESISMIDWSVAEYSGYVEDFSLDGRTQEDFFNFLFDGYLNIEGEGVYQFRLTSDDGSTLHLNDTILIENDGIHKVHTVTSPVQILRAGAQRITVKYFDYVLADTLLVEYKGPDSNGEWAKIPPEALGSRSLTLAQHHGRIEDQFDFTVFPNPVRESKMMIQLSSNVQDPLSIVIRNLTGSIIFDRQMDFARSFEILLPLHLETGVYLVTVAQASHLLNKRVVILP